MGSWPTDGPTVSRVCPVTNSANVWNGQIYSSSTKTSNAFTLNYVPIGIPGVNLFAGTNSSETPSPFIAAFGSRTAIRTLNAG